MLGSKEISFLIKALFFAIILSVDRGPSDEHLGKEKFDCGKQFSEESSQGRLVSE